jgi:shikimate dehydrogenase
MARSILCGLIGAGIQRSLSPALQEEEARHHGIRMHYQLFDLDRSSRGVEALPGLIEAARIMGYAGLNITYPCKQSVIALLDGLSEEARAIGAVNTVVREGNRLVGYNTDASGWSWGFGRALPQADLSRVVLLGAGGAGSAIAYEVLRLGATKLLIVDPDTSRACALAERMNSIHAAGRASAVGNIAAAIESATGLIHATPTGMGKLPRLPLPASLLRPELWVRRSSIFRWKRSC